jgi:hypothetical protein
MIAQDKRVAGLRKCEKAIYLIDAQRLGQGPAASWQVDCRKRIAANVLIDGEEREETVQG